MFTHLIIIEPLGLLYGSAGRFLSPENLVGRSGTSFPPSAATLSGIFAASLSQQKKTQELKNLQLAGPFWAKSAKPHNFYVPTPFNCLVKNKKIEHYLACDSSKPDAPKWVAWDAEKNDWTTPPDDKYESGTWISLADWEKLSPTIKSLSVESSPWKFLPHLHPRLKDDERHTIDPEEDDHGSLFLENSVQLDPDTCLVYLSNTEIPSGCYRFGGEGHLIDLTCLDIGEDIKAKLNQTLTNSFCLITPAVWGSNRLSYRSPNIDKNGELYWDKIHVTTLLTQRPQQMRYRFGGEGNTKRLSRGRYAVPAGSVYVLKEPLNMTWQELPESLFPTEGVSLKRWGCGLALPL
jgi:CRISPR-associated protein Cmr3